MSLEEFIKTLNIPFKGEMINDEYVINMPDSNAWDRLFITLESNDNLHIAEDGTSAQFNTGRLVFVNDEEKMCVRLSYNFNDDIYQCKVGELDEKNS